MTTTEGRIACDCGVHDCAMQVIVDVAGADVRVGIGTEGEGHKVYLTPESAVELALLLSEAAGDARAKMGEG